MTRASILAIGTELTQGQITNRNATWISARLTELEIEVVNHITVPDDRVLMLEALDAAAAKSELLFVTGGLGPTTDDFTRDVLADWIDESLEFRELSWEKIVRRLTERGIEVAESNRIQCFFPRAATVLENLEGTADGFRFPRIGAKGRSTEVFALPGPPREGQYLWERFVGPWLAEAFPRGHLTDLESWSCLGKSESSLAEIVEKAVARFGVKTGYRASVPYVEVKIWIPSELGIDRRRELLARLDLALAPYSVARNGADLADRFANALQAKTKGAPITLHDYGTGGRLAERLLGMLRSDAGRDLRSRVKIEALISGAGTPTPTDVAGLASTWHLFSLPEGEVVAVGPEGKHHHKLANPYPNPAMAERLGGYRAEMTLKTWSEMLDSLPAGGENR